MNVSSCTHFLRSCASTNVSISGSYIFNTEAHPIDTAALYCCSGEKKEHDLELQEFYDNLDLMTLFGLNDDVDKVEGVRWSTYKKRNMSDLAMFETDYFHDVPDSVQRLQIHTAGDHQRIMSIKGEKFTVRTPSDTKVVTIDGKNIPRVSTQSQQSTTQSQNEGQTLTPGQGQSTQTGQEQQMGQNENTDPALQPETSSSQTQDKQPSQPVKDTLQQETPQKITISINTKDALEKKDYTGWTNVQTPIEPSTQGGVLNGKSKLTDMLSLIKTFTEDFLENNGVKSLKTLHEKLKYYSLFHRENTEMLTCKAQPFYMRFSIMGEMFLDDFL